MHTTTTLPWHKTRAWRNYLRDLLLYRGRMRYTLSVSDQNPLGATDPVSRIVSINPFTTPLNPRARHAPSSQQEWETSLATALVEHEAGHIRHSGQKPAQPLLGWLWNALEDERQERLQAAANPELIELFDFLGDAIWLTQHPTSDILAGCLVWRWEHDQRPDERKFTPADAGLWERVHSMVEAAWHAPDSDAVAETAANILKLLGRSDDEQVPDDLPTQICRCGGGHGATSAPSSAADPDLGNPGATAEPGPPDDARIPGRGVGQGKDPASSVQGTPRAPEPILAQVEGYARALALSLRPPCPNTRPQPHPSRGEFVFERALLGQSQRPFDHLQAPAPSREIAVLILVDESQSMASRAGVRSRIDNAIRATLLITRAAEIANVTLGVWGFTCGQPVIHRPLGRGSRRRWHVNIASMSAYGWSTYLATSFIQAVTTLAQRREPRKLLIVIHDGEIDPVDADAVRQQLLQVVKHGILLQPVFVGDDATAISNNQGLFGHVMACPTIHALAGQLSAWLRAATAQS